MALASKSTLKTAMAIGGTSSMAGDMTTQFVGKGVINPLQAIKAGVAGALTAGAFYGASKAVGSIKNSPIGKVEKEGGFQSLEGVSKTVDFTYDASKIGKQMGKRGWTDDLIQEALNNPVKTVKTRDTRWLPGADGPLNDPATAYYLNDGGYVVRNNKTGVITQISNRNDPGWIAPWDTK